MVAIRWKKCVGMMVIRWKKCIFAAPHPQPLTFQANLYTHFIFIRVLS